MKPREHRPLRHGQSQSRLHLAIVPLVVAMLMGQFAPVGLLTPGEAMDHDCPHCAGLGGHTSTAAAKGSHHAEADGGDGHHGMTTIAHHSPRPGETSFCGCGADGTSLTILPPIGKTLTVPVNLVPDPLSLELTFAGAADHAGLADKASPFHPPRLS